MDWVRENPPHWDEAKASVIDGGPPGAFHLPEYQTGDLLPGEWWRVEENGDMLGYGWNGSHVG